jgi:hypothetical protein
LLPEHLIPTGDKNIHIVINILFVAFPQRLPPYFHGIPAPLGRSVDTTARPRRKPGRLSG